MRKGRKPAGRSKPKKKNPRLIGKGCCPWTPTLYKQGIPTIQSHTCRYARRQAVFPLLATKKV